MGVYHNLGFMANIAIAKAKEHNCNYNIILHNHHNGEFDKSKGSTYEMVADSYLEKDRDFVKLIAKTDDIKSANCTNWEDYEKLLQS